MKRYSPNFTQLYPCMVTGPAYSVISHINSLEACSLAGTMALETIQTHRSLHYPTRYPLTPGSRRCTLWAAWPRGTVPQQVQPSRWANPWSLPCKSRTLPLSHDSSKWAYRLELTEKMNNLRSRFAYISSTTIRSGPIYYLYLVGRIFYQRKLHAYWRLGVRIARCIPY